MPILVDVESIAGGVELADKTAGLVAALGLEINLDEEIVCTHIEGFSFVAFDCSGFAPALADGEGAFHFCFAY